MQAKGTVNCGICGHTVEVIATPEGRKKVKLELKSSCGNYQKLANDLTEVDPFKELFQPLGQGELFQLAAKVIPHPSCPGIAGILKTVEVAAGLALPQKADIVVEKSEG